MGADGLIGNSLSSHLKKNGASVLGTTRRHDLIGADRMYLDLTEFDADWTAQLPLELAYICAAATGIKNCQDNPDKTAKINVINTLKVIKTLVLKDIFTVFLSTCRASMPEGSIIGTDAYTRQKIVVERALLSMGDNVAIVRLAKVFAPETPLIQDWRDALAKGKVIHPFSDITVSPLSVAFVTSALEIIGNKRLTGITELSAANEISYAQIAYHLANFMGVDDALVQPTLSSDASISSDITQATTILDTQGMVAKLGLSPPDPFDEIDNTFGLSRRKSEFI